MPLRNHRFVERDSVLGLAFDLAVKHRALFNPVFIVQKTRQRLNRLFREQLRKKTEPAEFHTDDGHVIPGTERRCPQNAAIAAERKEQVGCGDTLVPLRLGFHGNVPCLVALLLNHGVQHRSERLRLLATGMVEQSNLHSYLPNPSFLANRWVTVTDLSKDQSKPSAIQATQCRQHRPPPRNAPDH